MEPHKLAVLFSWKGDISFSKHARLRRRWIVWPNFLWEVGSISLPLSWAGLGLLWPRTYGRRDARQVWGLISRRPNHLPPWSFGALRCHMRSPATPQGDHVGRERELHTPFQLWPPVCQACCGTSCDSALAEHPWGNPSMPHGAEESPSWALR